MFLGKKRIDQWFITELALITLFIMIGLIVPVFNLVALALCAYMIMIERSLDHIIDLLFFLVSLSPIFKLDLDGFALFNIVTLFLLARIFMENGYALNYPGISTFLVIAYVWAGFQKADLASCIRFTCQTLIGATVLSNPRFRGSLSVKRKNTMLATGITVSSLIGLMKGAFPRLARYLASREGRIKLGQGSYYYRFMGVEKNSNMYTVLLSISIAVFAVYLIEGRVNKWDVMMMGILLIFGVMTVSMSFILSIMMIAVLAMTILAKRNQKIFGYSIAIGIIAAVVILAVFGSSGAFQTLLFRFQKNSQENADMSSITTGRSTIWMEYIEYFLEHPMVTLFGKGLNAKSLRQATHNYYLESIYYLGLFGSLLYLISHVQIYGPSKYVGGRCNFYQHLPLLMLLFRGMARCLICEEKMIVIFLIYTLSAIDTYKPQPQGSWRGNQGRYVSPSNSCSLN